MLRAIGRVIRRFLKTLVVLLFSVSVVPVVMVAIALVIVLFLPVPVTIPERKVQAAVQPSYVYDSSGNLLTIFRLVDSNIPAKKGDFPKVLRNAVVAAEDRRFYTHGGIDIKGLLPR
jgi:penicillin-binding protein 1A